jgi:hypothetical protein
VRLKADFPLDGYSGDARVILTAMKVLASGPVTVC